MTAPEFLPVLSAGSHASPKEGACIMEYVSLLAGEPWSDRPSCTHPVLAAAARQVNDSLPDSERQRLVPLIGRLFGTAETGTDHERRVLSVRLAVWSARQVLHLVGPDRQAACRTAVDTAEAWADGRATQDECRTAAVYAAVAAAVRDARGDAKIGFLTGLLDEYDRLTGRHATTLTDEQYATLTQVPMPE